MKNASEIAKTEDCVLLRAARQRICSQPILKEVYDENFLSELVQNKKDPDNLLLFWLVNDNDIDSPTARRIVEEIEKKLEPFRYSGNFNILKSKLRQWRRIPFESTVTELEFAAEYYERGYQIELEPALPNNRKGDFSATKEKRKIYFEVKMVYKETSAKNKAAIDELSNRLERIEHPFFIGNIDVHETFQRNQSITAAKFIGRRLKEIEAASCSLPLSFNYPDSNSPIITVDVGERLPNGEKGFVGGFTYGGGITSKWADLRSKIEGGVKQLHPRFPGVVILRPNGLDYLQYDIENALFGDLSVNFAKKASVFRTVDRIFGKRKNTRLSAIIYYDKRLQNSGYSKKKVVYHNPFAAKKLSSDVFEGENVTQINPPIT